MKLLIATATAFAIPAVALAQPAEQAVKQYIDGGFAAMDVNKNGQVDRAEFEQFMRARLARQAAAFDEAFGQMDKDGNGKIDRKEASVNQVLVDNFDVIDKDRDGGLNKDELRAAAIAAQAAEVGAE